MWSCICSHMYVCMYACTYTWEEVITTCHLTRWLNVNLLVRKHVCIRMRKAAQLQKQVYACRWGRLPNYQNKCRNKCHGEISWRPELGSVPKATTVWNNSCIMCVYIYIFAFLRIYMYIYLLACTHRQKKTCMRTVAPTCKTVLEDAW